ncbi:hypothetical protein IHE45_03G015400 [Dioscorea alata]|uniref:Uncharacterized protein n=1 Tax=Dioscorea alata TaxID=55571 RepID=A0ACB7WJJ1_DIOAL|nr:hypothetical protein IHE45_03G015400 [Dioscorea alata]
MAKNPRPLYKTRSSVPFFLEPKSAIFGSSSKQRPALSPPRSKAMAALAPSKLAISPGVKRPASVSHLHPLHLPPRLQIPPFLPWLRRPPPCDLSDRANH